MKRLLTLFLALAPLMGVTAQETEITTAQAKTMYKNTSKKWVSIHDPSVVLDSTVTPHRHYIFGSHKGGAYTTDFQNWTQANPRWQVGTNTNAANKDAFCTPAVTKVMKGGVEVDFPAFNAVEWSSRTDADYNIDGNMWAPDVIWNPTMKKWCMYMSINGDAWHSSIVLLTSNNVAGPYTYQGPVVICGFQDNGHSYKGTDLELVLGSLSSLPSRYAVGNKWGRRWPHTIDPAVFYDEEGKLWMVYGSWSGGIWMLELNEENGLRDYDVKYPSTNGSSDGVTSDPYFGTKIAGGYYVSGEGPYIEHIGQYYYLFVSYGGFAPGGYDEKGNPQGGYEMRVFRSQNPNGPYKDGTGRSAIFDGYVLNYGTGSETRGMKLLGSYNKWGFMTVGECAQGHNSIIAAEDGRTYLVYHTKFNDGTIGHKVRTHQVFLNKVGWLVAAPFEYNGEELTDNDVATRQIVADSDIPGTYQVLFHKYKMDYANFEEVTPVELTLTADGKVTGARTGTWTMDEGTSYLKLTLNNVIYNGVLIEEQIDDKTIKTISFSAISSSGLSVWGYKYRPDYALAWQVNNQKLPVKANDAVKKNIDLYGMNRMTDNIEVQWTSSEPQAISNYGKYYPIGLAENVNATLTARISSGNYYWTQGIIVRVQAENNAKPIVDTWTDGIAAHYKFDDAEALINSYDPTQTAQLLHNSTTTQPDITNQEKLRNGSVVHTYQAANGRESYVAMKNPLKGKELSDGATIAFFVKRADNNLWDALFGCTNGTAKLFFTGNLYAGFNQGKSSDNSWIDINHPEKGTNADLGTGQWHHVIMTFQRTATASAGGITIYVDGVKHSSDKFNGLLAGTTTISTKQGFDYNLIVDHLAAADQLFIGNGSYWGSADACFDDFMVYDRVLSVVEISSLNQMMDRADTDYATDGIDELTVAGTPAAANSDAIYDLSGRRVLNVLKPGLYIRGGKKIFVK